MVRLISFLIGLFLLTSCSTETDSHFKCSCIEEILASKKKDCEGIIGEDMSALFLQFNKTTNKFLWRIYNFESEKIESMNHVKKINFLNFSETTVSFLREESEKINDDWLLQKRINIQFDKTENMLEEEISGQYLDDKYRLYSCSLNGLK